MLELLFILFVFSVLFGGRRRRIRRMRMDPWYDPFGPFGHGGLFGGGFWGPGTWCRPPMGPFGGMGPQGPLGPQSPLGEGFSGGSFGRGGGSRGSSTGRRF